jgi:hypothetical protein
MKNENWKMENAKWFAAPSVDGVLQLGQFAFFILQFSFFIGRFLAGRLRKERWTKRQRRGWLAANRMEHSKPPLSRSDCLIV